ncbi:MAG: tRNA (adenosine(37)-N6)-threonylcarbamoyltransferase complex transferase subunit TsaD [Vulcanimicrobiota bacterium]
METSCDETSVAIVEDGTKIHVNLISSQIELHERFGGVVPEIASRRHLEVLNPLMDEAVLKSGLEWHDIEGVCVSYGPGLVGSLLLGVAAAKTVAAVCNIPLQGINHLYGHIYANFLDYPELPLPALCLLVSGGHTALIVMHNHNVFELLGETRDDAAGECFDKSARILGLAYPGGPLIDSLARDGNQAAVHFPRALPESSSLEFSFSGLKTAVMYFVRSGGLENHSLNDVCASLQKAIVDVLVKKTAAAVKRTGIRTVLMAGGVACNSCLRQELASAAKAGHFQLFYPSPILCTDNAAMIACAAHYTYDSMSSGSPLTLDVCPGLTV